MRLCWWFPPTTHHDLPIYSRQEMLYCLLLFAGPVGVGGEIVPPFVAGFDRFARHNDAEKLVGGRLLLSELNCTACHATEVSELQPKLGPRLDGAGDRLRLDWVRRFLESPPSIKPGTTMPNALSGLSVEERASAVAALAAFLSNQHAPFPEIKATGTTPVPHELWSKGNVQRGGQLYHQVGCIACHEPDTAYEGGGPRLSALDRMVEQLAPAEIEELGLTVAARPVQSVPHGDLPAKYTSQSLTHFLLDPETVRPGGRMPSLKLSPVEAADIATFLLRTQTQRGNDVAVAEAPLIATGRRQFQELNCANCHSAGDSRPLRTAKPLAALNPSAEAACFGEPHRGLPHFKLDDAQIGCIRLALADLRRSNAGEASPKDVVAFHLLQFNCYACHERDQRGGVGNNRQRYFETVRHIDLGDEGRLPPPLTGVGRKLQTSWLTKAFDGTGAVRPHLLARMPRFPKAAIASLPELLAQADGAKRRSEQEVFGEQAGLAEAGRALLDTGCVQCHPVRGESLPGVAGIDLSGIAERTHPQWFREFLFNPADLKPGTRMPTFFPNGKSANPALLSGDVDRQIAAIWTYLKEIDRHPLPDKIVQARSQDFELVPKDRPILLRTFMDQAGTHAIAVGFPQRVHFAFDADGVRLVQAWRGRFLDAHGTWFDRFAPLAAPLGVELVSLPVGVPLAALTDPQQPWPTGVGDDAGYRFLGYRLDPGGVPTFLYRFDHFDVADRIEPDERRGLKRRLLVSNVDPGSRNGAQLFFRAIVGNKLSRQQGDSYTVDDCLSVTVKRPAGDRGTLREHEKTFEWIIPVHVDREESIEVEYQW